MKVLSAVRKNQLLILLVILLTFGLGIGVGKLIYQNGSSSTTTRGAFSKTDEERVMQRQERLEQQYDQLKGRINEAKDEKKLTEEQVKKALAKADEIYNYAKNLDMTDREVREEVRKKRQEWQKWARENNISLVYVLRIY